jgi:outer membrane protein assembly factor BamD
VVVTLVLSACGGSGRLRYETAQDAYERGKAFYDAGKYDRAAEYFQAVFNFGRTHEWAADAQLYLARAHYHNKDYILAASEFSRFSEIFRTDPRRADAEYERALAYYQLSPAFELDQTDTERAITQFHAFIQRFPTSPLVEDAERRIAELREKLARKQYEAARLYERRELWEAAAVTFEAVFDRFPDTSWADDALVGAMRAYIAFSDQSIQARQPERLQRAMTNFDRIVQIFPDSPHRADAEQLRDQAAERLSRLTGIAGT